MCGDRSILSETDSAVLVTYRESDPAASSSEGKTAGKVPDRGICLVTGQPPDQCINTGNKELPPVAAPTAFHAASDPEHCCSLGHPCKSQQPSSMDIVSEL